MIHTPCTNLEKLVKYIVLILQILLKKTNYDTDKSSLQKKISDINGIITKGSGVASKDELEAVENKIPNVSGILLTSVFKSKITEVENKIPDVTNLASKTELTTVENTSY